jgi:hypothetical protein
VRNCPDDASRNGTPDPLKIDRWRIVYATHGAKWDFENGVEVDNAGLDSGWEC